MGSSWWGRPFVGFCSGWGLVSSLQGGLLLFVFVASVLCEEGVSFFCLARQFFVRELLFAGGAGLCVWGVSCLRG